MQRNVAVTMKTPITLSGHKRGFQDAKTEIIYDGPLEAPIKAGTQVGKIVISLPGQPDVGAPLVTMSDVDKLDFVGRVFEGLNRMLSNNDE